MLVNGSKHFSKTAKNKFIHYCILRAIFAKVSVV